MSNNNNCYSTTNIKSINKLTTISVSWRNYTILKKLGNTGDSFNDVLTRILGNIKLPELEAQFEMYHHVADISTPGEG